MRLRKHTACKGVIDFEPGTGAWTESVQEADDLALNGVGDKIGDSSVALTREGDGLFVYLGSQRFDVQDALFHVDHNELEGGKSVFAVSDSHATADIIYPSWWTDSPLLQIGFDSPADEEVDVGAYIACMVRAIGDRHLLLNRFAGEPIAAPAPEPVVEVPAATYFARIPLSRSTPSTVYRFYDDKNMVPERFSPPHGWVADKDLYLRQMSGVISDEDRISEARARQIVRDLGGRFAPLAMREESSMPGESFTVGYYASGPVPRDEWHAGVKMHFVHWHYVRFFPNGDWISCYRPDSFDFWAFTNTVTPELLALAKQDNAPRIGDYDPLCSAGTYTIREGMLLQHYARDLIGSPCTITRAMRDGHVFYGSADDAMSSMVFVRRIFN